VYEFTRVKKYEIGIIVVLVFVVFVVIVSSIPNQFEEQEIDKLISTNKPNIVLIMADDLSVRPIEFLLENNMMPNLQKYFIDNGVTFTNSFVTTSVCCPSRATSLTGQYAHNHGVFDNKPVFVDGKLVADGGFEAFDDTSTVATWLKEAGYRTGYIGKYLNGYGISPKYIPPGWDEWYGMGIGPNRMFNFTTNHNGIFAKNNNQYKTDYISSTVVDFIIESDNPYFMYVSTSVPHSSSQEPKCILNEVSSINHVTVSPKYNGTLNHMSVPHSPSFNEKDISNKPFNKSFLIENIDCIDLVFRRQAESLRSLDDLIGEIFLILIEKNELHNTVVIFTSDNGYMFGEHRLIGKGNSYEESIRVPLFISAPSIAKQTVTGLVTNNDIAPTIADIAGIEPQIEVDGSSLLPIMKNSSKILRERFLIEGWISSKIPYSAVRSIDMVYVDYSIKFYSSEFYDLENDPYQLSNLVSCLDQKCLENIDELKNFLKELSSCGNGTCQEIEKRLN